MTEKEYMPDGPGYSPEEEPQQPGQPRPEKPGELGPRTPQGSEGPSQPFGPELPTAAQDPVPEGGAFPLGTPDREEDAPDIREPRENTPEDESPRQEQESAQDPVEEIMRGMSDEEREKHEEASRVLNNTESSADEIISAFKKVGGIPPDEDIEGGLAMMGHDKEKIDEVVRRKDEFAPEAPEADEETPEEKASVEEAQGDGGEVDELKDTVDGVKELMDKASRGEEVTEEEVKHFEKKADGIRAKIHERLFNGETGLLREEARFRRLAVKPTVSVLLALAVFYLGCLNIATRWATKRVGKG